MHDTAPLVLRDVSNWYHDARSPLRPRILRTLVAREDAHGLPARAALDNCPQTSAGCIIAAQCGL